MAYKAKYAKPSVGNTMMRVAFVLLIMVIVSVYMMGGLLAKYNATGDGRDEARVAKFDVNITGTPKESEILCKAVAGDSGTYAITIENQSEVAVRYTLSLTMDTPAGVTYTFTPANGDLPAGDTGTSTLSFAVDWNKFTEEPTGSSASVALDFTVTVTVTQID